MIISLVQLARTTDGKNQTIKRRRDKEAMAETETKFVEIGAKIVFLQVMMDT